MEGKNKRKDVSSTRSFVMRLYCGHYTPEKVF